MEVVRRKCIAETVKHDIKLNKGECYDVSKKTTHGQVLVFTHEGNFFVSEKIFGETVLEYGEEWK